MRVLLDRKHTSMMLAVVFFATFMDGLDGSVVNVALPDIGKDFNIDTATVSWVAITYMMVLAGTLVAFARIAADTGVKRVMCLGLSVFTVSSFLCGISSSFEMLIAARIVQAVGAGMMAAAGPMCCTEHLPVHRLAFGLSIVTIGASLGFALGPAVGGIILEFTTWHWIFLMNLPLGAVAVPLMMTAIPKGTETGGKVHLDIKGTVLLFAAIVLVTFGIETLSYPEMRAVSVLTIVLGLATLFVFIRVERTVGKPLLKLSMFKRWDFTAIFICLMLINMVFMGMLYLTPFYAEICLDMSALTIGFILLISAMITAIAGMPVAKWSDHRGRRAFCVASGLLVAVSFAIQGLMAEDMTMLLLVFTMFPMGFSWACVGGPMASRLVEHSGNECDMAASLTNEGYYIGGAIGTALAALCFTLFSHTEGIDIQDVGPSAFIDGFWPTAMVFTGLSLLIAVLSFIVRDGKKE